MTNFLERILNVVLTGAAVCIAGVLVYRQTRPSPETFGQEFLRATQFREWNDGLALAHLSGSAAATLQVLVLSDLECPGCRRFHLVTRAIQQEDSLALAVRFIPFSLSQHRFAAPAARLLECAGQEGHFDAMVNTLFAGQDSLGLKDWATYADAAGWHAGRRADRCAKSADPVRSLDDAMAFGERMGLQATPTVVVNGFRLNRVPTRTELMEARNRVRAGRAPFEVVSAR